MTTKSTKKSTTPEIDPATLADADLERIAAAAAERRAEREREAAEAREAAAREAYAERVERTKAFLAGVDDVLGALKEKGKAATKREREARESGDLAAFLAARADWHLERKDRSRILWEIPEARKFLRSAGEEIPNAGKPYPEEIRDIPWNGAEILAEFTNAQARTIDNRRGEMAWNAIAETLGEAVAEEIL